MATVGHTLTGLSIWGSWSAKLPGRVLPAIWPGILILCAHLIDLVEWFLTVVFRGTFTQHEVTHSPLLILATLGSALLLLAVLFRPRSAIPYILVSAAILSHIPLDMLSFREGLLRLYGVPQGDEESPSLRNSIMAEMWLYGFVFVAVMLLRAARCTYARSGPKKLAWVLLAISFAAALSRYTPIWIPVYMMGLGHSLVVLRREFSARLLWSVVPLTPLFLLLVVEVKASNDELEARRLQAEGRITEALSLHQAALAAPTRSDKTGIYVYMSLCHRDLGELEQSEKCLIEAEKGSEVPQWPRLARAQLYVDPRARGTTFYRPEETRRILEEMRDSKKSRRYAEIAQFHLDRLKRQGILP